MKTLKVTLICLLVVVTALFGITKITNGLSGKDQGPTITCQDQVVEVSVQDGQEALLEGVTAYDPQDGDLTQWIILGGVSQLITEDTAKVTYLVFDSDDNMARLQRTVRYTDYRKPRIQVSERLVFTTENTDQLLARLSAEDVIDGDISGRLRLSNLWATEYGDVYSVTVLATNSMGDTAQVKLPVMVQEERSDRPVIVLREQLIYLAQGELFDPTDYLVSATVSGKRMPAGDVTIESQVDTGTPGCYWVSYSYDNSGVKGTALLTVVVQ